MEGRLFLLVAALMVFATPAMSSTNVTQLNITKAGCGSTKLCVAFPNDCDPVSSQTCLFASVAAITPNGTMLYIELTGQSSGYIALGLNASQPLATTYVCGQNSSTNGTTFFTIAQTNASGALTSTNMTVAVNEMLVNSSVIQCVFNISVSNTTFSMLLGNGMADMNGLGTFNILLTSGFLNVTNPSSNTAPTVVSNTSNTAPTAVSNMTTMTTMTTAKGASSALHPYALLVLLSVLTLSILQKA